MRSRKRIENGGSSPIPRAHEKVCKRRSCLTVPRTGTGALAEKAKPCRENPGKGTRRRLIGGLHEWRHDSPTVPTWNPVNALPGEDAGDSQWETKTPWSFTAA
jgi:hypothetical protein